MQSPSQLHGRHCARQCLLEAYEVACAATPCPGPMFLAPDSGTALMVNIGIVLVFAAFYLKSLKKP